MSKLGKTKRKEKKKKEEKKKKRKKKKKEDKEKKRRRKSMKDLTFFVFALRKKTKFVLSHNLI